MKCLSNSNSQRKTLFAFELVRLSSDKKLGISRMCSVINLFFFFLGRHAFS